MQFLLRLFMFTLLCFSLAGCGEEKTEEYLIWHPNKLLKDVAQCQAARNLADERADYCKMVLTTTSTFMAVVTQQQLSPEEFGLKVLKKQMEFADLGKEIMKQKNVLASEQSNKNKKSQVSIEKQLTDLQIKYKSVKREIGMMLAAIGLIPPE